MTRIDFYILADRAAQARLNFACRLVEKVHRLGRQVYIATRDSEESARLDQLLWTFRPESFIPHRVDRGKAVVGTDSGTDESVLIGHNSEGVGPNDLLINLGAGVPANFSHFERLSEIVVQEEGILRQTRENYKFYRDRGYPIQSHDLRTIR